MKADKELIKDVLKMHLANRVEDALKQLNRPVSVTNVIVAPQVMRYQITPLSQGHTPTRVAHIKSLAPDIAIRLGVSSVRVVEDDGNLWIETASKNSSRSIVNAVDICPPSYMRLPVVLGVDTSNRDVAIDLADASTPHLLIAGSTGSGKSVLLHTIITGLIRSHGYKHLRLFLIDPKRVEFYIYRKSRHVAQSIMDTEQAVKSFEWGLKECHVRYRTLQSKQVRDASLVPSMPSIVFVIDEYAELMFRDKSIEDTMIRLAQLGRAAGIHLVIATQRPSYEIVTGLIKANFPARIALSVPDYRNSNIIIDQPGAEKLTGKGDAILYANGVITRFQSAMYDTNDIEAIVKIRNSVR